LYAAPSEISAVSCPSVRLCVAVDIAGDVVTDANPAAGAGTWQTTTIRHGEIFEALACPSTSLCVAGDDSGNVLTSTNPTGGRGAWHTASVYSPNPIGGIACPTTRLCVAAGDNDTTTTGSILVSTDPADSSAPWTATPSAGYLGMPPNGISCPSTTLCVIGDDNGDILTSNNPTASHSWTSTSVDPPNGGYTSLDALSCPSTSLCVAGDQDGNILATTDLPAAPTPAASSSPPATSVPTNPSTGGRLINCSAWLSTHGYSGPYADDTYALAGDNSTVDSCTYALAILRLYKPGTAHLSITDPGGQTYVVSCTEATSGHAPSNSATLSGLACWIGTGVSGTYGGAYAVFAPSTAPTRPAATSSPIVPVEGGTTSFFQSPSTNIQCELTLTQPNAPADAYCSTASPARAVNMGERGAIKVCNGEGCVGSPPDNVGTLSYGQSTTLGPFTCESLTTGMRCTVADGQGFQIARAGVQTISGGD
jgi:hypothetical protein